MEITLMRFYLDLFLCLIIGAGIVIYRFRNFMMAWWSVKRSGGNKLLVEVENPVQDYFAVGKFDNGYLRYLARKRADNPTPNRMISVEDVNAVVYTKFGVKCIRVDDEKNCVRSRRNNESIPGYNAEKMDEAVQTALLKPNPNAKGLFDEKTFQMIMVGGVVIILVLVVLIFKNQGSHDQHVKLVYDAVQNLTALHR